MTLAELINRFRVEANDTVEPYLWSDDEVIAWFNDAQEEAVIRGRLLHESEMKSVCEVSAKKGRATYPLSPLAYEITYAAWHPDSSTDSNELYSTSVEALTRQNRLWRNEREGKPHSFVQGDKSVRLVPPPAVNGTMIIECYRLPKEPLEGLDDEPEIHTTHHRHLVNWVLHKAFSIPDAEVFDARRAELAEHRFTEYFGLRPDSDLRRTTRHDVPHHVVPFMP